MSEPIISLKNGSLQGETIESTGEILEDFTGNGNDRGWHEKRANADLLSETYSKLGNNSKSERVMNCTRLLLFDECPEGHEKYLKGTYTCKVRLCPVCSWRRSLKIFWQVKEVLHEANKREELEFLFLGLSSENIKAESLSAEITELLQAWKRLSERKRFKQAIQGWFRALEVTYKPKDDTYNPHLHVILAVRPSYFKKHYIKQEEWTSLWQDCLKVDYKPIVDIRKSKKKRQKSLENLVAEGAKYATKSSDYIKEKAEGKVVLDNVVFALDKALHNRRLVSFGGLLKKVYQELNLEENEEDLVNITGEEEACQCSICGSELIEHLYSWCSQIGYYVG